MKRVKPKLALINGRWKIRKQRGEVYNPRHVAIARGHCRKLNDKMMGVKS